MIQGYERFMSVPGSIVTRAIAAVLVLLGGVASCAPPPPPDQGDLCRVFDRHPEWYDAAKASEARWGTPPHVLMAFLKQESSFDRQARPPLQWWHFIPTGRTSSARGYPQAMDATWREYQAETGGVYKSRASMMDALDFVGWYNQKTSRRLGIPEHEAGRLYLAYHEGHAGYARGSYRDKPKVRRAAARVAAQARDYAAQLAACEQRFKCWRWYQVWPFCF